MRQWPSDIAQWPGQKCDGGQKKILGDSEMCHNNVPGGPRQAMNAQGDNVAAKTKTKFREAVLATTCRVEFQKAPMFSNSWQRGTWLAQWAKQKTPDFGVVSLSPMMRTELT